MARTYLGLQQNTWPPPVSDPRSQERSHAGVSPLHPTSRRTTARFSRHDPSSSLSHHSYIRQFLTRTGTLFLSLKIWVFLAPRQKMAKGKGEVPWVWEVEVEKDRGAAIKLQPVPRLSSRCPLLGLSDPLLRLLMPHDVDLSSCARRSHETDEVPRRRRAPELDLGSQSLLLAPVTMKKCV